MIKHNIKNYLRDNSYIINIIDKKLYINNYSKIDSINETNLKIIFNDFTLKVNGQKFKVLKMVDNEILFNGYIDSLEFNYK